MSNPSQNINAVAPQSILYVGDLNEYGRGYQRFITLKAMGHDVVGVSHTFVSEPNKIKKPTFLYRVLWKLRIPLDDMQVNQKIIDCLAVKRISVVWIEKGNMIKPQVLKKLKIKYQETKFISVSEDDMYVKHSYSLLYKWGLRFYDLIFTTKAYNVIELKTFFAKKVYLFLDSYSEFIHKPFVLTPEEIQKYSCDVSAIGAFEDERATSMMYLAENGIKIDVWGSGWQNWVEKHPNLVVHNQFLFATDFAKAICATKINLNFLRKINRDEVTSRSIEIPACRAFMLTERTQRHADFFKEGIEADFFSNNEELLRKVKHYLIHEKERQNIAEAGYQRCLSSGYSMRDQLNFILNCI